MSTSGEINVLSDDIERAIRDIDSHMALGDNVVKLAPSETGAPTAVVYRNVTTPRVCRDALQMLFHRISVLAEMVKNFAKSLGKTDNEIKGMIKDSRALCICLDLDNSRKHADRPLRPGSQGWSGQRPRLKNVEVVIPSSSPEKPEIREQGVILTFPGSTFSGKIDWNKMEIKYPQPELVRFQAPVIDDREKCLGEGLQIARDAFEWLRSKINDLLPPGPQA